MSVEVKFDHLAGAERVFTAEEMYRMGIEASTPGLADTIDLVSAHKWFNLAALQGSEAAKEYRQQLTLEMSTREIAEAQRKAREWLKSRGPALATN